MHIKIGDKAHPTEAGIGRALEPRYVADSAVENVASLKATASAISAFSATY